MQKIMNFILLLAVFVGLLYAVLHVRGEMQQILVIIFLGYNTFLWLLGIVWFCKSYRKRNYYAKCSLEDIDEMTGEEFEEYLQYHFEKKGYKAQITKLSNDYGVDLILQDKKKSIAVQAKRYQANIGNSAVQEVVAGMQYYKCDMAMVITNSHYTKNAINLAKECDVELWDREHLKKEFKIKG